MRENMDALLQLKGTQEERDWLWENLESLSVREGTILAAALEWHPPDSMSDVVNHVLSLEEYEVDICKCQMLWGLSFASANWNRPNCLA